MALTREQVEHVANLARLALTEEEKERFRQQLSAVLDYAARLQELDTDAIPPTATVLPVRNVMRPDTPRPPAPREEILHNAPEAEEGCFKVPAIGWE
ncbi:MAG: Asp-tRNA(Asn)/Glu-tRNA(Gln) amidotransferase subunit GatC [Anaerolineae bacterium]|nr:Asp-tRNA(Asn)/Glu-tRNA(Gln) amidotransferase subunit GatC [Anaerolineae bacterium]MCX8066901.1 Asp-tRNA(Asn)/Glu-tRNA(Gln) amidotransferase subunit GatC [Anaerolineae bacterium]MDW7992057.1 Asp-tRNA(Asn)/Glu-tRNA(Gln) amidotransferase subunit GatC [Anaerolineae bacterium]